MNVSLMSEDVKVFLYLHDLQGQREKAEVH